ncbi:MAG: hypothetical protein JWQ89_4574 [Devosia sp.]|nr:hypothetical protein [Devosia sp.]
MTIAGPLLAEDHDRPYEYRTFRVGDRVRVRLSPRVFEMRVEEEGE